MSKNNEKKNLRIGITGSVTYDYPRRVYIFMAKIRDELGIHHTVCSGGMKTGADRFVKNYALEMGFDYKEYNPSYTGYNLYSAEDEDYYGKGYHHSHKFHRYIQLCINIDKLVIFIDETGPIDHDIKYLIKQAKKAKKKYRIIT